MCFRFIFEYGNCGATHRPAWNEPWKLRQGDLDTEAGEAGLLLAAGAVPGSAPQDGASLSCRLTVPPSGPRARRAGKLAFQLRELFSDNSSEHLVLHAQSAQPGAIRVSPTPDRFLTLLPDKVGQTDTLSLQQSTQPGTPLCRVREGWGAPVFSSLVDPAS